MSAIKKLPAELTNSLCYSHLSNIASGEKIIYYYHLLSQLWSHDSAIAHDLFNVDLGLVEIGSLAAFQWLRLAPASKARWEI